jgi:citronellol/citronellal dehydrogenase
VGYPEPLALKPPGARERLPRPMPSRLFAPGLLDGQVTIVTGGGSGLGRATALELAACGAHVVVAGRRLEPLEETAAACEDGRGSAVACDVREEDQVEALVDGVLERHGRIDLLVNNAGGQYLSPAEAISAKGFRTVVRLNLEGTWLMTHAVATKAMIPQESGKVVSVTLSPHHGLPGMAHSSAARAAVENLMRVLSIEWSRFNIRLVALASGHFDTEALEKYPDAVRESLGRSVPLGRLGRVEEQAWLVAYLASPAGDYFSGTTLTLDGARDNWVGPWPPPAMVDPEGRPLAEARRSEPPPMPAPPE